MADFDNFTESSSLGIHTTESFNIKTVDIINRASAAHIRCCCIDDENRRNFGLSFHEKCKKKDKKNKTLFHSAS